MLEHDRTGDGDPPKRVRKVWLELGLEPIGLQDSRHTAATWLDHAGVSPKVASVMMGHQVPQGLFGASQSPFAAAPTFSLASWSAPAIGSTYCWPRAKKKKTPQIGVSKFRSPSLQHSV